MPTRARRELTALRLASQRVAVGQLHSASAVVRWMLAMQAQDFGGAKWSIGLRTTGTTDAAIEQAIADREIVRSWPMRGTLHFVAPEDLGWMLDISAPRQSTWAAKRRRDLEITDAQYAQACDIAVALMQGGRVVRRDELLRAIEQHGIPTTAQRGYHLLWNMAHHKLIVFGPVDGKQPTFALLDEWVTSPRRLEGDEALAEFASRYFASHGPATERDFAWWSSLTLREARKAIAMAALAKREIDGIAYLHSPGLEPAKLAVHALPGFDEYLLGYQDRSVVLPAAFRDRIVPGNNGIFLPTLVVDGQVTGTWKRVETTRKVTARLESFTTPTTKAITGFSRAMTRYSTFIAKPVVVE